MESKRPNLAALFQAGAGVSNDELLELSGPEDTRMRAWLYTGDHALDLGQDSAALAAQLEQQTKESPEDSVRLALAITSNQPVIDRTKRGVFGRAADTIEPEYSPTTLIDIYHDDPDVRAAVETRASLVAGLGWGVEPRPHVEKPDPEQKARFLAFLADAAGEESVSLQLWSMYRDQLVTGTGYMEVERDHNAPLNNSLRGMKYARSYVTRVGKNLDTYYQVQGNGATVFRRLGWLDGKPYALTVPTTKTRLGAAYRVAVDFLTVEEGRVLLGKMDEGYLPDVKLMLAELGTTRKFNLKGLDTSAKSATVTVTNEMFHMAVPAMNDSIYGTPPLINAIRDWAANRYIREMNLNFWDNNTIPPLLVIASGERMPRNMADNIRQALTRNRGKDAFAKAVLVELPEGTTLRLEPLTQFIQTDGQFMGYLDIGSNTIHKVLRTPRTLTEVMKSVDAGDAREIHRWFIESVVRPDQAEIEHRMNWMAKTYLGITDYAFRLSVMSLDDAKTLAEIDEIYLRGAVYCPNDVLGRLGMPSKPGGEFATKTVPGVGVLLLEAVKVISDRVLAGERVRDILVPRGTKTPSSESPIMQPAKSEKLGAADAGERGTMFLGFSKDGPMLVDVPDMIPTGELP